MNILFFGAFPVRTRDNESLMIAFRKNGHKVFFLNHCNSDEVANALKSHDIYCEKMNGLAHSKLKLLKQVFFLIRFIRRHNIDVVFSHLEPSSLVTVLAQRFVKARCVVVRHHADDQLIGKKKTSISSRIIYSWAKHIVVVSNYAKSVMIEYEKVDSGKIAVIPLAYDFNLFDKPDLATVERIRSDVRGILLIAAGRMVPNKQFEKSIELVKHLQDSGIQAHLILVGEGPEKERLINKVKALQLLQSVEFAGYKKNIMDYLQACDILIHPSISESSSVIVKEAGLCQKPVIVCDNVGDFNEVIKNGENGFLVSKENFVKEAAAVVCNHLLSKDQREVVGQKLENSVKNLYEINKTIGLYEQFL